MAIPVATTIKAIRHWTNNPVSAVKDWFGVTPENYQGDILNTLLKPNGANRVTMKSGHGVGKTTTMAWAHWVFMVTRKNCRIPATAPTQHQLRDILWPEIAKWHQFMPQELASMFDISETHVRQKEFPKTWFSVGRTSNKQENLQGFHNDHVLVLCEEASGIPGPVFEVIEGILSNAEQQGQEAKLLLGGNPTQTSGEFYNSFHKNKQLYVRFTVSGDLNIPKDPNGGKMYTSKRVSQAYRENMAKKYGLNSPVYDVRVRGIFPAEDDRAVIPLAWAERAQFIELPPFDLIADPVTLVMDVARFGGDETVLGKFRKGHCIEMQAWPKTSTNECVDILWEATKTSKVPILRTIVDEPGVGGGVVDVGRRAGLNITPYNGGATLKTDFDPPDECRMFANRRSRDWWRVRRALERNECRLPEDEVLVNQLASVKYDYFNEKIKVETKKEMRDRLGDDASPDRADVIVMGLAPYHSLITTVPSELVLDALDEITYGRERPTAVQDF